MYSHIKDQLFFKLDDFELAFNGKLKRDNRWVKLAAIIPWKSLEEKYATHFSSQMGRPGISFRIAFGALIIKSKLNITDQETVDQITENHYLQFFVGYKSFLEKPPFDSSQMVHFRSRISKCGIENLSDEILDTLCSSTNNIQNKNTENKDSSQDESSAKEDKISTKKEIPNNGELKIDATAVPADVRFPTDITLLNEARENAETILDEVVKGLKVKRPRTHRKKARWAFVNLIKQKGRGGKKARKACKKQINFLKRTVNYIDNLAGSKKWVGSTTNLRRLWIIKEVLRQQSQMQDTDSYRIDDRIVSLRQPQVRPIVRGKAGRPTEFGAKLSLSTFDGYCSIDRFSWDAYNEGNDLVGQTESYKKRFGHYPEVVFADNIYGNRKNRAYLKQLDIRFGGIPLGRKEKEKQKQYYKDTGKRNEVEGKFGVAKRKFGLDRILEYNSHKAKVSIFMIFIVMNLETKLRKGGDFFTSFIYCIFSRIKTIENMIAANYVFT